MTTDFFALFQKFSLRKKKKSSITTHYLEWILMYFFFFFRGFEREGDSENNVGRGNINHEITSHKNFLTFSDTLQSHPSSLRVGITLKVQVALLLRKRNTCTSWNEIIIRFEVERRVDESCFIFFWRMHHSFTSSLHFLLTLTISDFHSCVSENVWFCERIFDSKNFVDEKNEPLNSTFNLQVSIFSIFQLQNRLSPSTNVQ